MKNSGVQWIGDIPKDWSVSKMQYISEYLNGYAFKPSDWSEKGLPIIRIQDLTGSNDNPNYFDGFLPERYRVRRGDILISWAATLNSFIWDKEDAWLNQHIFKTQYYKDIVTKNFFFWLTQVVMLNMNNANKHGIMMQHVTTNVFNKFSLPLPPLAEQKAIADFLDTKCAEIDALLQDLDAEVKTLAEYKKSIIAETVTKGLNHNVPMKSSGISWVGDIPSHWSVRRVKDCYRFETGFTPDTTNQTYYDDIDGEDWACISDLQSKYVFETKSKISQSYLQINRKSKVQQGSLLFSFKLSVGTVAFAGKDIFTNEAIAAFQPSPNVNLQFLYYSAPVYIIHNAATNIYGASILNSTRISNAYIIFPPLGEQKAIADYLDKKCAAIEQTITSKLQQIETLKAYKSSLIYEYVTGKKQVPV